MGLRYWADRVSIDARQTRNNSAAGPETIGLSGSDAHVEVRFGELDKSPSTRERPAPRAYHHCFSAKAGNVLRRTRPPLLKTPFQAYPDSVFTPNDVFYVRWHWEIYRRGLMSTVSAFKSAGT